ncbi:MAG TPA: SirB2 family protein, partial [Casimicrobiaceae bacterium]
RHRRGQHDVEVMEYATLKMIHMAAVALSGAGFFARGVGMLNDAAWVRHRIAKTLPHLVDTVLIVSALWLAWILRLTPTNAPWIGAKIVGLFVYIGIGMVALRFGRTKTIRRIAWLLALLTFAYIVSVAITKDPRGFLVALM